MNGDAAMKFFFFFVFSQIRYHHVILIRSDDLRIRVFRMSLARRIRRIRACITRIAYVSCVYVMYECMYVYVSLCVVYVSLWIRRKRTSKKLSRKIIVIVVAVIVNNCCSLNNINIKWRQKEKIIIKSSFVGKYMATKKIRLQVVCFLRSRRWAEVCTFLLFLRVLFSRSFSSSLSLSLALTLLYIRSYIILSLFPAFFFALSLFHSIYFCTVEYCACTKSIVLKNRVQDVRTSVLKKWRLRYCLTKRSSVFFFCFFFCTWWINVANVDRKIRRFYRESRR